MLKFRSSIFSFRTFQSRDIPKKWWLSVVLAIGACVAAESMARYMFQPLGGFAWPYWNSDAAIKFEYYRSLARKSDKLDLLVIGDSRAARNFDPTTFVGTSSNVTAYNLGWPANFPLSLRASVFPLLKENSNANTVALIQAVASYANKSTIERFEQNILSSWAVRRWQNPDDLLNKIALLRIYSANRILREYWVSRDREFLNQQPPWGGFMPKSERNNSDDVGVTSVREKSVQGPDPRRLATITELADLSKEMDFELVIVIPPGRSGETSEFFRRYREWVSRESGLLGFSVLDMTVQNNLTYDDFLDDGHLNPDGARKFSRHLGEILRPCLSGSQPVSECVADRKRTIDEVAKR